MEGKSHLPSLDFDVMSLRHSPNFVAAPICLSQKVSQLQCVLDQWGKRLPESVSSFHFSRFRVNRLLSSDKTGS